MPLVIFEIYLRITWKTPTSFYRSDPFTGSWHIAGAKGWWEKPCFRTWVAFNSQGLRDTEHSSKKPYDTYRIVVLGDSYAEAMQVKLEDSFPKVLERELQKALERKPQTQRVRVEVINLGVSGFGTDQELLALRHYGLAYEPDLVLLAFLTGNDVRNNHYMLEERANGEPVKKPYFTLENGKLVLHKPSSSGDPSGDPWWKKVGRNFKVAHWAWEKLYRIRTERARRQALAGTRTAADRAAEPVDDGVYLRKYPPEWEEAWHLTEALIAEVARTARNAGADFLLVSLTDPFQLASRSPHPRFDPAKPVRLLSQIAEKHNLNYLPLLPLFQKAMEEQGLKLEDLHYSCDGHWTPLGHRLAGQAIAEHIATRWPHRLPPSPAPVPAAGSSASEDTSSGTSGMPRPTPR